MYERIVRLTQTLLVGLWPVFIFVFTFIARLHQGGFPLVGKFHHQLFYFSQTAVFSYAYTDPLYGTGIIYHPLIFLFKYDFAILTGVCLFLATVLSVKILEQKQVPTRIAMLAALFFSVVGYIQAAANFFLPLLVYFTFILAVLYLLTVQNKICNYVAVVLSIVILFFGIHFVAIYLILLIVLFKENFIKMSFYFYALLLFSISIIVDIVLAQQIMSFPSLPSIGPSFIELGSPEGASMVLLSLGAAISFFVWEKRFKRSYVAAIAFVALSFMHPAYLLPLTLLLSLGVSYFIITINKEVWVVDAAKIVVVVGIFCTIMVSYFVFHTQVVAGAPNQDQIQTIQFIQQNTDASAVFLASQDFSVYLESLANRKSVEPSFSRNYNVSIYQAETIEDLAQYLRNNDVDYVVIDTFIADAVGRQPRGLLRLVNDRDTFRRVFSTDTIQVWQVLDHSSA